MRKRTLPHADLPAHVRISLAPSPKSPIERSGGDWPVTTQDLSQLSKEEFDRLVAAEIEKYQKELSIRRSTRRADIPDDVIEWMALPPGWTVKLARLAGSPSLGDRDPEATLEELTRPGFLDRHEDAARSRGHKRRRSRTVPPKKWIRARRRVPG